MKPILSWTLRLIPAIIMAQTLPFKFSGAPESVEVFTLLTERSLGNSNLESLARYGTGIAELICIIMLLVPKLSFKGAILTIVTMSAALICHTLFIGFQGPHGLLAFLALIALTCSFVYAVKTFLNEDPRKSS